MQYEKVSKRNGVIIKFIFGIMIILIGVSIFKIKKNDTGNNMIPLIIISSSFSIYIHLIIGEIGRSIFGIITGYKFLFFRVGRLTLVKEENIKLRRYSNRGVLVQALFDPPEYKEERYPYFLFNLGGALTNIIISIMIIIFVVLTDGNIYVKEALYLFSILGIFIGLISFIPLYINSMPNSGMQTLLIKENNEYRYSVYVKSKIDALLSKGIRYKDMPFEWFNLSKDFNLRNSNDLNKKLLEIKYYLDKHNFNKIKELLKSMLESERVLDAYKNEFLCDFIFCELMTEGNEENIRRLYSNDINNEINKQQIQIVDNNDIKTYIKKDKFNISKIRLEYAYEVLINKDDNKSNEIRNKFNKLIKTYPYKGLLEMEVELMELVDKKLKLITY